MPHPYRMFIDISIHPPLAGWDRTRSGKRTVWRYFNPPTPCGVGLQVSDALTQVFQFQSTHPLRGGTPVARPVIVPCIFQSTHPLRGGTSRTAGGALRRGDFNPPTPCGVGRADALNCADVYTEISIHPPLAGWDKHNNKERVLLMEFQSTHPLRGGTTEHRSWMTS